jgi:hypothetical protein
VGGVTIGHFRFSIWDRGMSPVDPTQGLPRTLGPIQARKTSPIYPERPPMPAAHEDKSTQQGTSAPKPTKAKRRRTGDLSFQTDVAVLRAQGLSQTATARYLDVDQSTIARVEKTPAVQTKLAELRDLWRAGAHTKINSVSESAWNMVQKAAESNDAKSFDAATRGLAAMEKISASVVGAPQRVEVSGIPGGSDPKVEIKALLFALWPEKFPELKDERMKQLPGGGA